MRGTHPDQPAPDRAPTVHPRACGEHTPALPSSVSIFGSSPRMRGTLGRRPDPRPRRRFIPAHAGNTAPPGRPGRGASVHPRACGEHSVSVDSAVNPVGSSPRMRGTRRRSRRPVGPGRFIPAHAGNTNGSFINCDSDTVHPRACGEHSSATTGKRRESGSSPRMRGTPRTAQDRIRRLPVHPRACGEHASLPDSAAIKRRFIPAHAGNTGQYTRAGSRVTVHPRACGEHATGGQSSSRNVGSSPRMRGTH